MRRPRPSRTSASSDFGELSRAVEPRPEPVEGRGAGLAFVLVASASAALSAERTPEGPGVAAKYPGDAGLGRDPAVLMVEHFEDDVASVKKRWTNVKDPKGEVFALSTDVPPGSPGKRSLRMRHTRGKNTGGHLWRLFDKGVDEMYARFYVKFDPEHDYVHHFVKIGAWRDSPRWPQGEAGHRHDGARSFQTGIEPYGEWGRLTPVGKWFMYTYWCDMKSFDGGKSYYGNGFFPERDAIAPRGEWICVEFMVRANSDPAKSDGAQGFWIDGKLAGFWGPAFSRAPAEPDASGPGTARGTWRGDSFRPGGGEVFGGFRWRTDLRLKINTFWLLYYMTDNALKQNKQARPRPENRVWFDHVVVATKYIGPIVTKRAQATAKPAAKQTTSRGGRFGEHGAAVAAAEGLARKGDLDGARDEYRKVLAALGEGEEKAAARREVDLRIAGLGERDGLVELVKRGFKAHGARNVSIDFAGRRERARLVSADEKGVSLGVQSMETSMTWPRVKPCDLARFALAYAADARFPLPSGEREVRLAVARLLMACGERAAAAKAVAAVRTQDLPDADREALEVIRAAGR